VTFLLGRCARQLLKSCADARMVYSRTEHVFILEHRFASKSSATVREAFSSANPEKEVPNKATIHRMEKNISERRKCLSSDKTAEIMAVPIQASCDNGIRLQEFCTAIGSVTLCLKRFMSCTVLRFAFQMEHPVEIFSRVLHNGSSFSIYVSFLLFVSLPTSN
jgi:hypothetical protein